MTGALMALKRVRSLPGLLAILCALVSTGCSTFNRDWEAARLTSATATGLEGRWEGAWRSEVNAHTDRLRCLVTKDGHGGYHARFQARYRKLIRLTFSYTVPLTVTATNGGFHLAGAASLGWYAGGRYTYAGQATPTNFFSTYDSRYDRGTFEMSRPRASPSRE